MKIYYNQRDTFGFHNALKHDYHFIIKELAKEAEGQFNCLGENTEKYKLFSPNNTKSSKD